MNEFEFIKTNVKKYQDAGFTGKGMKIGVYDRNILCDDIHVINVKISAENGYIAEGGTYEVPQAIGTMDKWHGNKVVNVLRQIVPDAIIYALPTGCNKKGGHCTDYCINRKAIDFCREEGIDVITRSQFFGIPTIEEVEAERQLQEDIGTVFLCAVGNDGEDDNVISPTSHLDHQISVGSLYEQKTNAGTYVKRASYTSSSPHLDIMGFGNLDVEIPIDNKGNKRQMFVTGTSFASPFDAGMVIQYKQWFLQEYKRKPTFKEVYEMIKSNCKDMGEKGRDDDYGFGLFILPDFPTKIVKKLKYPVQIDPKYDRMVIGVRDVGEAFLCDVKFDNKTRIATVSNGQRDLIFKEGSDEVEIIIKDNVIKETK